MDHPCSSCGIAVADGAPFCSNCRAPQIRFVVCEPEVASPKIETVDDEVSPASTRLVWPKAFYSAFLGGVFSAVAMKFLFGLLGLGFIAGGVIAVYAYRRRVPGAGLSLASGVKLGAVCGLFGFLVFFLMAMVQIRVFHQGEEIRKAFFANLDKTVKDADPQVQQEIQQMAQYLKTPEGFVASIVLMAIFVCALFVFFSILGGAIGSSMTRRKPG